MELDLSRDLHKEQMEKMLNTDEYHALERQLTVNNPRFEQLSKELRLVATYLIRMGIEEHMPDLWRMFYTRRIPNIEEFLTTDYIGNNADFLFPKWHEVLNKTFRPGSTYFELVFGGAIGTGKTTCANMAHMYNLVKIASLRHPQMTLGVQPTTLLVLALFSVTLDKSETAVMGPFRSMMEQCPLFQKVRKIEEFEDYEGSGITPYHASDKIVLPNNIMVYAGSTLGHSISYSLFGASLDEAEFRISGAEDAMKVYNNLKERVESRFMGSRFTLLSLMSSAKYTTGIIAKYTEKLKADDPHTLLIQYPIWEVREFDAYHKGHFYVLRGTQSHPSRVLDEHREDIESKKYIVPPRCDVIKVPEAYRRRFDVDINEALRNLAGVQTLGGDHPFDDLSRIEKTWLMPEFRLVAPLRDQTPLIDRMPPELFRQLPNGKRLARYPQALRYLHLDLAEVAEAGLSMGHKEFRIDEETGEMQVIYVTDFVCWIVSPDRINLDAVRDLVVALHDELDIPFANISADQYQSAEMRQKFTVLKLMSNPMKTGIGRHESKITSVDRTSEPYRQFSQVVSTDAYAVGESPKLKDQMLNVQIDDKDNIFTVGRKDEADAVCAWVHNALMCPKDVPIYEFKPIELISQRPIQTDDQHEWERI